MQTVILIIQVVIAVSSLVALCIFLFSGFRRTSFLYINTYVLIVFIFVMVFFMEKYLINNLYKKSFNKNLDI